MARAAGYRDEESLRFLFGACHKNVVLRTQAFETISKTLDGWFDGYGSPKDGNALFENHQNGEVLDSVDSMRPLITEQLPDILRLAETCPFPDVRGKCESLLRELQDRGLKIPRRCAHGPSDFIPQHDVIPVDTDVEETRTLYEEAFLQNNRLENCLHVMGLHPQYLDCFLKTQNYILKEDGPLPYDYRHYIAMMAAGRHQSSYLINLQKTEFLLQGGDENWLKGIEFIPQKLRDLYELNKLLAHRPWLINRQHIEKLLKTGKDSWSLSELTHAIVLLVHFHALSSFVYGCGINPEINHESGHTYRPPSVTSSDSTLNENNGGFNSASSSPNTASEMEGGIEALMERMKKLSEDSEDTTEEELIKRFQKVESQSAELKSPNDAPTLRSDIMQYVEDPDFTYQDFAKRGSLQEIPTFRAQDYSWEEQGFSLANRLYADIGTLLDNKFATTYELTYNTMGDNENVDTSAFRRSIWHYIHCMFGIRHDDYDYAEINQLLERSLKAYIKTVTCYPERVTKKDYQNFMKEFKDSEKVHVNLMLLEARMQAELLYALRAIMRYMT
ncbi:unnamed protein product [Owenia fusiformis]|uniref:Uncharacterized protein n=1 Tax=Owenia fusiformis TaxID=6347 RepID=A0A8J1XJY5_OWEFU|nr:unnamed protein product [Owenia fusiformis]